MTACGKNAASGDDTTVAVPSPNENESSEEEEAAQIPENTENLPESEDNVTASVVCFTTDISSEGIIAAYEALGWTPTGNVAVKLSTCEPPASNYLRPELIKELVQSVEGTIVECNTAYGGSRTETAMHMQVAEDHGFTEIADVDILDADGSVELPVDGGSYLETNYVGSHFTDYDSYIVLSHFKGHAMAGFGGTIPLIREWLMMGMSMGSASAFMIIGPATKITNLGALKIVLGLKKFIFYLAFVMAFSLVTGLVVNFFI